MFVGYASNKKGYKCFDPISKKMFVTMDVTFFKLTPFFTIDFQERRKNEDSDQLEYFQLEDSPAVYSPTPLVQFESPNIK